MKADVLKVAVVGSGHGGCAMTAALAMRGYQVSLVKLSHTIHLENFKVLRERKQIRLTGIEGCGEFPLREVTTDPAEALPDADLILVYYVSNYHEFVADRCAPYLHEGQILVLNPGYAGSLLFERQMKAVGNTSFPLFAEFETLPYSSRITEPGTVAIVSRNVRHPFATYPASRATDLIERLSPVLGECVPRTHLLEVALHNPNLVIHTLGVLMNVSMVEHPDKTFAMYRDGFSPSMWNIVKALDREKMATLEAVGAPPVSYFDEFRLRTFEDAGIDGLDGFKRYASEAPDGPFEIAHRYVTEDVPMGLGLMHSLAEAAGIDTPICDSLIHIADALLPTHEFWRQARTLDKLWDGTLKELLDVLTK